MRVVVVLVALLAISSQVSARATLVDSQSAKVNLVEHGKFREGNMDALSPDNQLKVHF